MVWIAIFGALALAGAVAVSIYAVQLMHRAADVRHEIDVTLDRVGQLRGLVDQLELPAARRD